jgi:hypothetical protein
MLGLQDLSKLKKLNDLVGTQTRDLLACSIAPQPNMLHTTKREINK